MMHKLTDVIGNLPDYVINKIIMFNRHPCGKIINTIMCINTIND